ncbi:MAG: N-methyl-L-tryptophan oxidase [SAR202 cluster bacterium]|nr:N-methyl-L-tryptophan oxidase [SAR202 cluster bacterium]|tara:strand:- start:19701 stop:20837 length:1137 start_codon:yes stop_codon:yes gene_type:complete
MYDCIVIGLGGMGSASLFELSSKGLDVLGIEQFEIGHDKGSSHGFSRIIRLAYYEGIEYVPLVLRAHARWLQLEKIYNKRLLNITGALDIGLENSETIIGSRKACEEFDLPHEIFRGNELSEKFPAYLLPEEYFSVFQKDGGFLVPESCINMYVNESINNGADVKQNCKVFNWESDGNIITVFTSDGNFKTKKLVFTAGAWTGIIENKMSNILTPERQVVSWFKPVSPENYNVDKFPVFNMEVPEGRYYGFPIHHYEGMKIGRYGHLEEKINPDLINREITKLDISTLRVPMDKYFQSTSTEPLFSQVCIFTNTPDSHFVLDYLPGNDNVFIASGFSGHGFKFASVIGELISDLIVDGGTEFDLGLFSLDRFKLNKTY